MVIADTDPSQLLDRLNDYVVPVVDKWINRQAR